MLKEHYGQVESKCRNWKKIRKCPGLKVISIILKASFAANDNNKPVLLLATSVDGISWVSYVMKRTKGSAPKTSVSWPNTIVFYSNDMCGVDVMNQKTTAYRLDCKIK